MRRTAAAWEKVRFALGVATALAKSTDRTPTDVIVDIANESRAAGRGRGTAGFYSALCLLSLWPYVDYIIGTLFDPPQAAAEDAPSLGDVLPEILPASLVRTGADAAGILASSGSLLSRPIVTKALVAAIAASVQYRLPRVAQDPGDTDETEPSAAGVRTVPVAVLDESEYAAELQGHVAASTEALSMGFVPAAYVEQIPMSLPDSPVRARGGTFDDSADSADALRTSSSAGAEVQASEVAALEVLARFTPSAILWAAADDAAPDSPTRSSRKGGFDSGPGTPTRSRAVSEALAGLPPLLALHVDSVTSLPAWLSTHVSAPLVALLEHLQFEEYRAVVSNQATVPTSGLASTRRGHAAVSLRGLHSDATAPGFFAIVELVSTAALGGDVERLTTGLIDPLMTTNVVWWLAAASPGAASYLTGLFADVVAADPFARHAALYVKATSNPGDLHAMPRHHQLLSCFRRFRLRLTGIQHALKVFDVAHVFRPSSGDEAGTWVSDPRLSAALSLNATLALAVRMLEREWKDVCHRHRRQVTRGSHGGSAADEFRLVHVLRYVIDAVRRTVLHDMQVAVEAFRKECRDAVSTVAGLRRAYDAFAERIGTLALAVGNARPVNRRVESIVALAFEICLSPNLGEVGQRGLRQAVHHKLRSSVAGLCSDLRSSGLDAADALVNLLTFNSFFQDPRNEQP